MGRGLEKNDQGGLGEGTIWAWRPKNADRASGGSTSATTARVKMREPNRKMAFSMFGIWSWYPLFFLRSIKQEDAVTVSQSPMMLEFYMIDNLFWFFEGYPAILWDSTSKVSLPLSARSVPSLLDISGGRLPLQWQTTFAPKEMLPSCRIWCPTSFWKRSHRPIGCHFW